MSVGQSALMALCFLKCQMRIGRFTGFMDFLSELKITFVRGELRGYPFEDCDHLCSEAVIKYFSNDNGLLRMFPQPALL